MDPRIDALLADLTPEEKVALVAGSGLWHAGGVPRLGIAPLKVTDGPIGARGGALTGEHTAACFPCGTALAATWDPALIERVGAALGDEARSKGARVLLGPTVNIHRSPLAGRNFECYAEDPQLAARIAVAFIRGVQGRGVAACVKHFVCNDSEFERHTISSEVPERALREVYLPPFEAAVREAGVWCVMAAYNRVNGTYAGEHPFLLQRVLREEWGFDGTVMSDWFGTQSTEAALAAGLDLEMPGPARHRGEKLLASLRDGRADAKALDASVRRLLELRARTGLLDDPVEPPERAEDRAEHRALAREAAAEATVLLRNQGELLPLDAGGLRTLAVVGPAAEVGAIQGGGSARVTPHHEVSPLEGLGARLGDRVRLVHEPGCTNERTLPVLGARRMRHPGTGEPGARAEFFAGDTPAGEPVHTMAAQDVNFTWLGRFSEAVDPERFAVRCTARLVPPRDGTYTFGLASAGRSRLFVDDALVLESAEERGDAFYGLGSREVTAEVPLRADGAHTLRVEYAKAGAPVLGGLRVGCRAPLPEDAFERAVAAARDADAAVVVVGLNADWETEGRDRKDMRLPGRQVELLRAVAAANPRTVAVLNVGAPVETDWIADVPATLLVWYPGQEAGHALADVLVGDRDPGGRLPQSWPARLEDNPAHGNYPGECGRVRYGEGIFVGYRYYELKRIAPRFPFGHGLSYARFEYGALRTSQPEYGPEESIEVKLEVANAGGRAGREVVQLYLRDPESSLARPEKELVAFEKLTLAVGERRELTFRIPPRALACWWPGRGWVAEPGAFELHAGRSAGDLRVRTTFTLRDA